MLLRDDEYREIERIVRQKRLTVSEWARLALRNAARGEPLMDAERKLAAVRAAVRNEFPTGDVETILADIGRGYTGGV